MLNNLYSQGFFNISPKDVSIDLAESVNRASEKLRNEIIHKKNPVLAIENNY